jgi:hypothetical protein
VLFDTFVVRSLLVPSVMHLLGDWNWWPTTFPKSAPPATANASSPSSYEVRSAARACMAAAAYAIAVAAASCTAAVASAKPLH